MANKYLKRCSNSLVIREMKMIRIGQHSLPILIDKIISNMYISIGWQYRQNRNPVFLVGMGTGQASRSTGSEVT
jgi:hypothetical protein